MTKLIKHFCFLGTDIKKHTDECIRAVEESIAEIVLEGSYTYVAEIKEI